MKLKRLKQRNSASSFGIGEPDLHELECESQDE